MIYFDTAYLAKCYLTDAGYEAVRDLAAAADAIACCEIGRVELAAVVHRAWREGRLSRRTYEVVRAQIAEDERRRGWVWLPVTAPLLAHAAARVKSCGSGVFIRAMDALHLTCAVEHGFAEV